MHTCVVRITIFFIDFQNETCQNKIKKIIVKQIKLLKLEIFPFFWIYQSILQFPVNVTKILNGQTNVLNHFNQFIEHVRMQYFPKRGSLFEMVIRIVKVNTKYRSCEFFFICFNLLSLVISDAKFTYVFGKTLILACS